ncbi:general substrate transporter [Aspergillus pseudoustus]|uniref:General substrate transporter n=1 Tax=Aspergillus pseudoustus TaxID=1810923 RepID=A0ABR4KYI0_9EURO
MAQPAYVSPRGGLPSFWRPHILRLNVCVAVVLLSSATMGFDGSMMNGLQSLDTWASYFGHPSGTWLGLMNAVLPLGVIVAAVPAGLLSDKIGRRFTIMVGIIILVGSAAMQAASHNVATFILARFFVGVGMDIACVPAPVLISEIAHPAYRGIATSLFQTTFFLGAIASSWCTFGTFNMTGSTWSWRIPSALQAFFPILQFVGLFFVPESPRWLIANGRGEEARSFLVKYFAGGNADDPIVEHEYGQICARITAEHNAASLSWSALWKTPADRTRLAITVFTPFISQWSGNGIITYYLSIVLDSIGIKDSFTKTLINGILQIFNYIAAIAGALLVDRVGRRPLWLFSALGMLVTFTIFTVCSAVFNKTENHQVAVAVVVFIFLYYFHYDVAVTPLTFAYPTEIHPFHTRQKGLAICNFCNGLALMFNSFVNPIALEAIGWRYYLVYIALLIVISIVIYLFYAETKGYSLEEIADVFEGPRLVAGRARRHLVARAAGLAASEKEVPIIVEMENVDKATKTV